MKVKGLYDRALPFQSKLEKAKKEKKGNSQSKSGRKRKETGEL